MLVRLSFVLAAVVVSLAMPRPAVAQSGMCIMETSAQYQRMGGASRLGPLPCDRCRQTVSTEMSGGSCTEVSSSTGATTSPSSSVGAYAVQTAISSFWDGWRRGREMARQRAIAEEQQRQARVRAARERVRQREVELAAAREENRRQREAAFRRAKDELARELRGLAPSNEPATGLKRTDAPVSDVPASGLKRSIIGNTQPAGLGRVVCSAAIARLAAEAALAGREEEGVFLSGQSQTAFTGQRLDVECPASARVPEIGAIKCTVRENGRDIEVPCDEEPLRGFYPELLESTVEEINRLAQINERYPDLQRAKTEATNTVREKRTALERARTEEARQTPPPTRPTPTPAPKPRTQPCSTDLCRQAQRELEEARDVESDVVDAMREEAEARTSLRRNAVILREVESNPGGVSNMLSKARQPRSRRP